MHAIQFALTFSGLARAELVVVQEELISGLTPNERNHRRDIGQQKRQEPAKIRGHSLVSYTALKAFRRGLVCNKAFCDSVFASAG